MPPGGDGYYYFSAYMRTVRDEISDFNVEINGDVICTVSSALGDVFASEREITSCSGVAYAVEGLHE